MMHHIISSSDVFLFVVIHEYYIQILNWTSTIRNFHPTLTRTIWSLYGVWNNFDLLIAYSSSDVWRYSIFFRRICDIFLSKNWWKTIHILKSVNEWKCYHQKRNLNHTWEANTNGKCHNFWHLFRFRAFSHYYQSSWFKY